MSLVRQIWIAVILIMIFAIGGNFTISTLAARAYLARQLNLKNLDDANSLAISMSLVADDRVAMELLLNARFASGQYQFINFADLAGKSQLARGTPEVSAEVPNGLRRLIPFWVAPATVQVQKGVRPVGVLSLQNNSDSAYEALWQATKRLTLWFIASTIFAGIIACLILRTIKLPLRQIVEQARDIGAGGFPVIPQPDILELRPLAAAVNAMSVRIKSILREEGERLERLRRQNEHDPLTGLLTRKPFLERLSAQLSHDDASAAGLLLVARFAGLAEINLELGRETTDQLISSLGGSLLVKTAENPGWLAARLNGSDFALLIPGGNYTSVDYARDLAGILHLAIGGGLLPDERRIPVGATRLSPGEPLSHLLARVDTALIAAERGESPDAVVISGEETHLPFNNLDSWRSAISEALEARAVRLAEYPVIDAAGGVLHVEAPLRLFAAGSWLTAGLVMPWAARLGLMPRLDTEVTQAALRKIARQSLPVGINVSAEAFCDAEFRLGLIERLRQEPELAAKLWLEVPEIGAVRHHGDLKILCAALKPLGVKLGLEHAGHFFSRIVELHDLALDFIKIEASIIRDIGNNSGRRAFLSGLCMIAHNLGMLAIAEGVQTPDERRILLELGVDAITGPVCRAEVDRE